MNTALYYRLGAPWLRIHRVLRGFTPPQRGFRILTFHDVFQGERKSFARLIDHVIAHHGILRPEDVEKIATGTAELPPDEGRVPCLITFDDGYVSDATVAAEVLNERGIKAVRGSSLSAGYHKRRSGDQRRLTRSHTPCLFRLSATRLQLQISNCRRMLRLQTERIAVIEDPQTALALRTIITLERELMKIEFGLHEMGEKREKEGQS